MKAKRKTPPFKPMDTGHILRGRPHQDIWPNALDVEENIQKFHTEQSLDIERKRLEARRLEAKRQREKPKRVRRQSRHIVLESDFGSSVKYELGYTAVTCSMTESKEPSPWQENAIRAMEDRDQPQY